jgi:hypothetical protein
MFGFGSFTGLIVAASISGAAAAAVCAQPAAPFIITPKATAKATAKILLPQPALPMPCLLSQPIKRSYAANT